MEHSSLPTKRNINTKKNGKTLKRDLPVEEQRVATSC
jgi:hypothetical protein